MVLRRNRYNLAFIFAIFFAYVLFSFYKITFIHEKTCKKENLSSLLNVSTYIYSKFFLNEYNKSENETQVKFPHVFELIPHLKKSKYMIKPRFETSRNRTAQFVIGIPTVKRDKASYLKHTLDSLFNALDFDGLNETLIVVFIGEVKIRLSKNIIKKLLSNLLLSYSMKLIATKR